MNAASLTVKEASDAYANAMRNPATRPRGVVRRLRDPGVCPICWTFHDPTWKTCVACHGQPNNLDAFAPITYSVHTGQMHHALRDYKDDPRREARRFHAVRLTAILWRFLERHERCLAAAAGVDRFDLVATVPSKTSERDEERGQLRTIVGEWCDPTAERWRRVLHPADPPLPGRAYSEARYVADAEVAGRRVLLIDHTWVRGGAMQTAAWALRRSRASAVAGVVIGRHLRLDYEWQSGSTRDAYEKLPRLFDWTTCAVHVDAPDGVT